MSKKTLFSYPNSDEGHFWFSLIDLTPSFSSLFIKLRYLLVFSCIDISALPNQFASLPEKEKPRFADISYEVHETSDI